MYKCDNCGARFNAPITRRENYGMGGAWYDEIIACPRCKVDGMIEEIEDESEDQADDCL